MRNSSFVVLILVFVSCSLTRKSIVGTFISGGQNELCNQLTLFEDYNFEFVTCGEITFSSIGKWERVGDTIIFSGGRLPFGHSKYFIQGKKLYRFQKNFNQDSYWTFKRKSRRPRPFRKYSEND